MGRATSVIQINGASYNADTGKAIAGKGRLIPMAVIDGFIRRSPRKQTTKAKAQSSPKPQKTKASAKSRATKSPSARAIHHRTEHSKTLVRTAVQRPSLKLKSAVSSIAKPVSSRLAIEKGRVSRAASTSKHSAVNRFSKPGSGHNTVHAVASPLRIRPRPRQTQKDQVPQAPLATSHQRLERMLDEALTNADAHKQLIKQHRYGRSPFGRILLWPKWLQVIAIVIAIAIIGLIILWRYVPQVSVSLVAHRAHIHATASAYTPAGYKFSKASATNNGVNIRYKSADSDSSYTVNEVPSKADSASNAANTISKGSSVQTSQVGGNTVYIYGSSGNALWVNNGIKYTISNNSGLSSQQLLQIVQGF